MSRIVKAENVDELLLEAHQAHLAIRGSAEAVLEQAIQAGERLLAAKEMVPRGEWTSRLENTGISRRNAQQYMMVARERDRVLASGAGSIRQALQLIADRVPPRREPRAPGTKRARPPKEPSDRYAEGYDAGYRAARADGAVAMEKKGRVDSGPSQRDLLWLINLAHPDRHQDPHDVLVATRLTVWLNELRGKG
jgi:hypothetical protein